MKGRIYDFIFYGKGREFGTNKQVDMELGMLCLHLLQISIVYINTLLIQELLAEPEWANRLTPEDLRVVIQTRTPFTIEQNHAGYTPLVQHLQRLSLPPEAFASGRENTSTYWMPLATFPINAGYPVRVVNPRQTHHFAKSHLQRAKTDLLDAVILAHYAAERLPKPWIPPPPIYYELRERLLVRQQLLNIRIQLKNHYEALRHCPVLVNGVREPVLQFCAQLNEQSLISEHEIKALRETGAWASNAELLSSIPGLGTITITWLLVGTQAELVAYAGLAPMPSRSQDRLAG